MLTDAAPPVQVAFHPDKYLSTSHPRRSRFPSPRTTTERSLPTSAQPRTLLLSASTAGEADFADVYLVVRTSCFPSVVAACMVARPGRPRHALCRCGTGP